MSGLITNLGLQAIGINASHATAYSASIYNQVMAVDDGTEAFLAADTKMNDATGYTQEYDQAFDGVPTRSAQTIIAVMTIATGNGNFVIKRVSQHNNVVGSVDGTTATLMGGNDGLTFGKTTDFSLAITQNIAYTSV